MLLYSSRICCTFSSLCSTKLTDQGDERTYDLCHGDHTHFHLRLFDADLDCIFQVQSGHVDRTGAGNWGGGPNFPHVNCVSIILNNHEQSQIQMIISDHCNSAKT